MRVETFFEKFDLVAAAPNAVATLREFVLELGVQGRLSHSLPDDPPVPSRAEFQETAAALASALGLRPPKKSVDGVESPFDIPSHWRWLPLADIGAAQTGTTPSKADRAAFDGEIPFIKPADILPDSINYSNESLTRHGAKRGSRLAPAGSLLMVCIGTIGKCNLIERECAFNQQINALTPVAAVDPRYLLAVARSRFFQDAGWNKSSSTTIAILNKGKWLSIPVPIAPLAEQKRIVEKVDELMALCDRLEAQQQERETTHAALARAALARFVEAPTPANLNFLFHKSYDIEPADLRKSIFTLAVSGKLQRQDPQDEPSSELLTRIDDAVARHRRQRRRRSSTRQIAACPVPFALPGSWKWAELGRLAYQITDGVHKTPKYVESGVPFLSIKDISSGLIDFSNTRYVTRDAHREMIKRCHPELGDLLFTRIGTLGKTVVVATKAEFSLFVSVGLIKFPQEFIVPRYLEVVMNSPAVQIQFQQIKAGGSHTNKLNLGPMHGVQIPLPPLAEQTRIVAKVDQLMALVDQLETQLAAYRATAANLLEAVVAELAA